MAKQTINVGTTANDNTGDPIRTAYTKCNQNFTELYDGRLQSVQAGTNVTVDNTDPRNPIINASGGGGGGTVTTFSSGNLSPLFTTSVANATSTPALSFTLSNQNANKVFAGPTTGADAAPTFRVLVAADIPSLSSLYLPIGGGTLTGALTLNADPTNSLHAATKQYVDAAVTGLWDDRGTFDASGGSYPSSGGSGSAGAVLKGDIWTISVAGTLPTGQVVEVGDTVRALTDTPGNTQGNWAIAQNNLGYTPITNVLTSAQILVGNASNVAAAVSMSGAISISNTGATSYAGTVPVNRGGTNLTAVGTAFQYLRTNSGASALEYATLPIITPEDYGAVGDGSTDDSTALQNAITAASTSKKLVLGLKNYRIATGLTVPANTDIVGSGNGSIISATANINLISVTGNNVSLDNFTLQGNDAGAQRGIVVEGNAGFTNERYNVKITRVNFYDMASAGLYVNDVIGSGSGTRHEGGVIVSDCFARSNGIGFWCDTRAEYNNFSNCKAIFNTTGVRFDGGNNFWTGGSSSDNATGFFIGSGTNDGHGACVGASINHNTTNVQSTSTATGYLFGHCFMYAGNITLTTTSRIKFYGCEFSTLTISANTSTLCEFKDCCFATDPTVSLTSTTLWCSGNTFVDGTPVSQFINNFTNTVDILGRGTSSATMSLICRSSDSAITMQVGDDSRVRFGSAGSPPQIGPVNAAGVQAVNGPGLDVTSTSAIGFYVKTGASVVPGNLTNQTASTEITDFTLNLVHSIQFATGALTTQRAARVIAPTYSFVGSSTITSASTFAISGPPVAGTNATITNTWALNIESGKMVFSTAGGGIAIKEGTNATMGTATLVGGTVTVNTTAVTATSRIYLTVNGGTLTNVGAPYISARSAGTSFTISSTNVLDTADVSWLIVEPAP